MADFAYVATWNGFVHVAFVIDVFARMIVGWRVSRSMSAELTLDALEQALWVRKVVGTLVHHGARGRQYLSIRYSERLLQAGIEPSVGSAGDAYDNALAESVIGLFKTEVIRPRGPWRSIESVEYTVLEWVDWFNNRRMLEPTGNIPPVEMDREYYRLQGARLWQPDSHKSVSDKLGAVHVLFYSRECEDKWNLYQSPKTLQGDIDAQSFRPISRT